MKHIFAIIGFIGFMTFFVVYYFRIDLTADKRYTISEQTKRLMQSVNEPLYITVYLEGDINASFLRLKKSTAELLHELSLYAKTPIHIRFENPSLADTPMAREKNYEKLINKGLDPTVIYDRNEAGQSIQKKIFPWVKISVAERIVSVCILKNIRENSGEENIHISIENLEFEITDGIRRVLRSEVSKIAFIEGHGELSEAETYDISKSLSHYFQIDRGVLGADASVLDDYKLIIIAKPVRPFSESDKYIIDQYIMRGGRVLWLIDGVKIENKKLSSQGMSPATDMDVNLHDQLFRYGVRINPVVLQDVQCASIPINIAPAGNTPQFEPAPWYYGPLLLNSHQNAITKNISEIRAEFCSSIDVVGENNKVHAKLLLATSDNTHIVATPTIIDLGSEHLPTDKSKQ